MGRKPPGRRRGRPREAGLDRRILQAALDQLGTLGFERMSLEAVAAKAGVSKPTLYRRWKSKADLATAALRMLQQSTFPPPTGNARQDVIANLREFQACLLRPNGMRMIGTLLVEEQRLPELLRLFRERIIKTRRAALRRILADAVKRGELDKRADIEAALNCLVGAYYARYLAQGNFPADWPERTAGVALDGLPWRR
ncbi:TetR/AcrR family transcriptional regulator [bacterium]|nr:MAG: TetR/AcrR family transcriptional regulator [bacterium]RIK59681.1 MAG: TetR family transcriptional regulator [Planctomycetota bacterium]